ncbi:MAG: TetR/AcrR family transcriptional regulator [Desulfobulbaceae bacterium]|nr:TetR/AcrR family transcriptional regulator [Desulfobulbaceae bacterium]
MNDTRTKILDVADDLVQRVGLNAMSYKDISEAIGIRKASIHHHFPKKENLVDGLLERCAISYGDRYQQIVDGGGQASDKLRKLAAVFADGLSNKKLCLIGSISTNRNTLEDCSCHILQSTIKNTVSIFAAVFEQGRHEGSLTMTGTDEETAFAFFSFLVGAQTIARSHGGIHMFHQASETFISAIEK